MPTQRQNLTIGAVWGTIQPDHDYVTMQRIDPAATAASLASNLTLPAPRVSAWVVETTPADTETWLAGLVLAEPSQTAQQLYQALYTLNRMELDPNIRVRIMELYREPVANTVSNLQSHFSRFALPLRPRLKQLSDFLRQLHIEMSYGYKHVLTAAMDETKPWDNDAVLLAVARAIEALGNALLRCYQVYMPAPSGLWKEIHSLYWFAEQNDRHRQDLSTLNGGQSLSVNQAYLQVLLLGLCGPYQLPLGEVLRVQSFLARWAERAEINSRLESVDPTGSFLLDLESDHPATPFPRDVSMAMHARPGLRAVNAVPLARTVHGFILRLQKGEPPRAMNLGFETVGSACIESLKRMLRFWAMAGRRHFTRRQRKQPLSLCVGLPAIHFFASGQNPFIDPRAQLRMNDDSATAPSSADLEAEAKASTGSGATPGEGSQLFRVDNLWQLRDESAGGLLISKTGDVGSSIRVGDLVGIHDAALDQWRIGVARWVKSPDTQQVEMGVEMLAPHARPIAIVPAGAAEVAATPALLLPAVEALRQPASIIVARGTCQRGEDVVLWRSDQAPRRVRVLNVVEQTNTYSQIVFADVNP